MKNTKKQATNSRPARQPKRATTNAEKTKYHLISPDGFPITPEPFASKTAAKSFIPQYCKRFQEQGYYSAVGLTIPLCVLPRCLKIIREDAF